MLSKQLLKSGASVSALICEAQNAESKADFIHKLRIAQKECDETIYWLELLNETKYISKAEFNSLNDDLIQILKIIKSSILAVKQKLKKLTIHNK